MGKGQKAQVFTDAGKKIELRAGKVGETIGGAIGSVVDASPFGIVTNKAREYVDGKRAAEKAAREKKAAQKAEAEKQAKTQASADATAKAERDKMRMQGTMKRVRIKKPNSILSNDRMAQMEETKRARMAKKEGNTSSPSSPTPTTPTQRTAPSAPMTGGGAGRKRSEDEELSYEEEQRRFPRGRI